MVATTMKGVEVTNWQIIDRLVIITKKTCLILSISINVDRYIFPPKMHMARLWLREIELNDDIVIQTLKLLI